MRKMVGKKLHDELTRIEVLHRHWNKLSPAERASVAKISPDLSAFFRRDLEPRSARGGVLMGSKLNSTSTEGKPSAETHQS